jgi:hypothetical protein
VTAADGPTISLGPRSHNSLDDLEAGASSPDGQATVRIRGRSEITFSLAPGVYESGDEVDMERRLTQLARLGFVARMRAYYALRSRGFGQTYTKEAPAVSPRDQQYVDERSRLIASGSSPDGRIQVTVAGMEFWTVDLQPGTLSALDETSFCAAVSSAAHEVVEDQFRQIRRLKDEIYG